MKKQFTFLLILVFILGLVPVNFSVAANLASELKGKILLQVESKGEAWYVNPDNSKRYYLGRPADAFQVMRELGLGISNKDFDSFNSYAPIRLSGKILLKVEDSGKAYYVNPTDRKMHYLGRPADAFKIMRELGLGITNNNLGEISISENSNTLIDENSVDDSNEQILPELPTLPSVDSDNDGMSDVDEDKIGTNKNKWDTDGDNVPDGYDDHPLEAGVKINKVIKLHNQYGDEFGITLNIPMDYYSYLKTKKSHDMGKNLEYITNFVTPFDPYIIELRNKINALNEELRQESWNTKGFNDIRYIVATDETQILEDNYYSPDINTGYNEYPKYPIETIVDGSGDCEDLAFLGASLKVNRVENTIYQPIEALGMKGNKPTVALIIYPSHVAIGYAFNEDYQFNSYSDTYSKLGESLRYYNFNNKKFIYIEPTNSSIDNIPDELFSEQAQIIELN